nr:nucleolar protein 9-like [Lonchura striata domestica]
MAAHAGSPPGPGMSRQRRQSWPRLDPDTAEYFRRALETLEEGLSEEELALFTPNVLSELAHHLPAIALLHSHFFTPNSQFFQFYWFKLHFFLSNTHPALLSPACASLCLQGALGALRRSQSPSCARFCRALIGCLRQTGPAHQHSPLLTSLQDPAHSRLLEAAMTALDPPGLRELFRGHLRGHLRGVASHPVANHGLQRLLDHAPEDVVEEVLSELGPALEEPLARGHPGVVLALLGAALRHPRLQGEVLRWLFQALRCWAPPHHPHCLAALAKLRPLEGGASAEGAELQPSPAGSRALQLLLRFRCTGPAPMETGPAHIDTGHAPMETGPAHIDTGHAPMETGHAHIDTGHAPNGTGHAHIDTGHAPNGTGHALSGTDHAPNAKGHAHSTPGHAPRKRRKLRGHAPNETGPAPFPGPAPVAAALAALSGAALAALARGGPGSRLCDAILGCGAARKWLLGRLQGQWAGLARDRFGSRVLDTAWASGDARQRARLATELAPHLPALLRDPFGRGVARNFSLELFRRDRPGWERLQRGAGPKGRGLSL